MTDMNWTGKQENTITFQKIRRDLFPVLRQKDRSRQFDIQTKISEAKLYLGSLMQLTDLEMEFIERFEMKEYRPELLFNRSDILERIADHPMALWKCRKT